MCDTMEHIYLDTPVPLQSDAYRIGRRTTRSSARDEEALDEIEAIEAHLSLCEHQRRAIAIADAFGDRPPVTLESLLEESMAPGEYQLFVSEVHEGLLYPVSAASSEDARAVVADLAADFAEAVASSSEPSSPALMPTSAQALPTAAAMFRAASAAAASPTSVVGPRRRRHARSSSTTAASSPPTVQHRGKRSSSKTTEEYATFDSISVTSDGDDSFDGTFDEINIEITDVTATNERYTTVITAVTPHSPTAAHTPSSKRRSAPYTSSSSNKRGYANTPSTPGKRGRRTTNTTYTVIETTTNYLEDKPSRTGSFAGEEVLRISSVVIEETDVDILN